jgi:hypothetical protein
LSGNKKSQVTVLGKKGYERKETKISPLTSGYVLCYASRPEKETQGGNTKMVGQVRGEVKHLQREKKSERDETKENSES